MLKSKEEKKDCLHCGSELFGRRDKKYCSDYCRSAAHNEQNRDHSTYIRRVNNVLRKNRRILAEHNPKGKSKISGSALMEEGFNFAYYTNVYETKKGGKYFFCYDQGYIKLEDGMYALVVRESYVK
ncbi:MAG: putative nucleic acid-binding Zn ribbon protein [Arenicella sp.]|jgi:predicted nucleic acid-binding Zn ribbon protein